MRFSLSKIPKTYYLFPVGGGDPIGVDGKNRTAEGESVGTIDNSDGRLTQSQKSPGQKGVAIILALMIITFMVGFIADLVVSSRVANQMSVNIEERGKADYLARSGFNLARFLLTLDWGLDLKLNEMAKQPVTDGAGDFWAMLNGLPIGGNEVKMLSQMQESFDLSEVMDSKVINQLDLFGGSFVINIEDEDSKINVNYLVKENLSKKTIYPMLLALFSCPAEKEFLDRKDLTPEKLAARLVDYIDDNKRVSQGADYSEETGPYDDYTPKRGPKNLPLDSIDELRLVSGWDDEIHAVFSPYLTVYPIIKEYFPSLKPDELAKFSAINVNTTARGFLGCLFSEMNLDCKENFAVKFRKTLEDQENFSDGSDLSKSIRELACYEKTDDLDKGNWFKANSSTFRLTIQGVSGDQTRNLTGVLYRMDPGVMKKKKVKHATDLLYWSMN